MHSSESRGERVGILVLRFRRPNHPEQGAGGGVSGGSPQSMVALMVYKRVGRASVLIYLFSSSTVRILQSGGLG